MNPSFHILIPARYHSTRLLGKLLYELDGQTVLERTYRQALLANPQSIQIATDHEAIAKEAQRFGASIIFTSSHHTTGTDRIAEAVKIQALNDNEIVVNVQGDEPFIPPQLISQVACSLYHSETEMATLCWPLDKAQQLHNQNIVKVVRDSQNHALYFSRSAIPLNRSQPERFTHVFRHVGLYAYRVRFLLHLSTLPFCELEGLEALEQLRVLWAGYKIKVEKACTEPLQDINSLEDFHHALQLLTKLKMKQS